MNIVIIGAGGHAKVIVDLLHELNYNILGFYDDNKQDFLKLKFLGKIKDIDKKYKNFVIAIGDNKTRKNIYEKNKELNYPVLIHPKTLISKNTKLLKGTVILHGSVLQTDVSVGMFSIVNTKTSIDHESKLGNFVNLCPNTTLCGNVVIGDLTFVGAGTTLINNITVTSGCVIGSSSNVVKNILIKGTYFGNPIKKKKDYISKWKKSLKNQNLKKLLKKFQMKWMVKHFTIIIIFFMILEPC